MVACKTRLWLSEVELRTQGSRPNQGHKKNPRPRPRIAFPRTDSLEAKDRNARGQGPRTQAQVLSKKKRSSQKIFKQSPLKNVFQKIFQALHKILTFQKIVLSLSRGQANFRGLEASRPRPRTWPSRPRTSKCVLEDSTSVGYATRDSDILAFKSKKKCHHMLLIRPTHTCSIP